MLENPAEKKYLSEKIIVIVKQKEKIDTAVVDHNLNFAFQNVKSDSFGFRIVPPSKLPLSSIKYSSENEIKVLEIGYSPVCKYSDSRIKTNCPTCDRKNQVVPIVYGLIMEIGTRKNKKQKSKRGGCIVTDCQPNWYCKRDSTEF